MTARQAKEIPFFLDIFFSFSLFPFSKLRGELLKELFAGCYFNVNLFTIIKLLITVIVINILLLLLLLFLVLLLLF